MRILEPHMIFNDLRKAYDNIPLSKLWEVLDEINVNSIIVNTIKNILYKSKYIDF